MLRTKDVMSNFSQESHCKTVVLNKQSWIVNIVKSLIKSMNHCKRCAYFIKYSICTWLLTNSRKSVNKINNISKFITQKGVLLTGIGNVLDSENVTYSRQQFIWRNFSLFCSLKPFSVSFQANLPLLQADLLHCARLAHQTPQQYARQHLTLEACGTEPGDIFQTDAKDCAKRRTPPDTSVAVNNTLIRI